MRSPVVTLAAAAILIAGCGSVPDTTAVKSVVTNYYRALANDDGTTACSLLSSSARAPFEHFRKGVSCAELLTVEAQKQVTPAIKSRLQSITVTKVEVAGQSATASVAASSTHSATVTLVKEGDGWRIQGVPAATG